MLPPIGMPPVTGWTDAEITAHLREQGVPDALIDKWLRQTKRQDLPAPNYEKWRQPAPKPDRGRTGRKRASTPRRSEASVQREIIYALTNAGWRTWRVGQYNARRTQDAGVPDVYAMRPWAIGYAMPLQCWVEVKRSHGGRQSVAQREFQRMCEHAGVRYILARSVDDIKELL